MSNGSGDKKQLGKIMLKQRLVTQAELDELLAEQRTHPGQRLATTAVKSGKVAEVDLLKALSEQHGLPGIDLTQVVIPSDNLKLVPVEIARQHLILPVLVKEDRVYLAMADPNDRRVVDEIEFVTQMKVVPVLADPLDVPSAIERAYLRPDLNAWVQADELQRETPSTTAKPDGVARIPSGGAIPAGADSARRSCMSSTITAGRCTPIILGMEYP